MVLIIVIALTESRNIGLAFKMVHVEFYKNKIALLLTDVLNISEYFVLISVHFPFEFN